MPKKKARENSKRGRRAKAGSLKGIVKVRMHGGSAARLSRATGRPTRYTLGLPGERENTNGTRYERQRIQNPSDPKEREKMLEKRKKLTLEAFRIAYEDHHPRKGS